MTILYAMALGLLLTGLTGVLVVLYFFINFPRTVLGEWAAITSVYVAGIGLPLAAGLALLQFALHHFRWVS
jgi:hypothetical protein